MSSYPSFAARSPLPAGSPVHAGLEALRDLQAAAGCTPSLT